MSMGRIIDLHKMELTCAQILMMLVAEDMEIDTPPELIRAMDGLHTGIGGCGDVCGILTGGACAIAALAGGNAEERRNPALNGIIKEYYDWFKEYNEEYNSNSCDVLIGELKINKMTRCLNMIEDAYQKIIDLFDEYDIC